MSRHLSEITTDELVAELRKREVIRRLQISYCVTDLIRASIHKPDRIEAFRKSLALKAHIAALEEIQKAGTERELPRQGMDDFSQHVAEYDFVIQNQTSQK